MEKLQIIKEKTKYLSKHKEEFYYIFITKRRGERRRQQNKNKDSKDKGSKIQ